jgi:roadblock/LC7 domain-containing protein
MTKAKAATIVAALINMDYEPTVSRDAAGDYKVSVIDQTGVLVNSLKTFADNNTITGRVRVVDYT